MEDPLTLSSNHVVCVFQLSFSRSYVFIRSAATCRVVYRAIWFELIRLHFQHTRTATTVLLVPALIVHAIAAVGSLQISFCGVY